MAKFETNELSGSLFKNDRRTANNNQPHATGTCKIDGIEYWVSAWTKTSKAGTRYQSLAFNQKDVDRETGVIADPVFDDDIPF